MSSIVDKVKTSQDKDGMLRRALERIIQLYTDKSHFVYELLQNAEDAEATSLKFIQHINSLEVLHNGRPFTEKNLQGLCDIGQSDKIDNLNQIGEFGVGFKSVFGICDTVRLYSDPSHFPGKIEEDVEAFSVEINDFTNLDIIDEEPIPQAYTTRFMFPFAVGHNYSGFSDLSTLRTTLAKKLQNLGITTLLFMRHLESIEYEIETNGKPIKGEYALEKEVINDHCSLVSAIGVSERDKADSDTEEIISYLKFARVLDKYPERTVDIAFPVKVEKNEYQCLKSNSPYVSVYFPTETESKLNFIVQGPYRTTPNRSSIPADDSDNTYLARETAILLRQSLRELRDSGKLNMSFIKTLPIDSKMFNYFGLFYPLYETVIDLFRKEAIIPSQSGKYIYAKSARIARREDLVSVFSDDLLTELIGDGDTYNWLPTFLTEDNKEYGQVYKYLVNDLDVTTIRTEGLRTLFVSNPEFLPDRTIDWLVKLYGIFEKIPGEFSKNRYETNMITADIVRTSTGKFVAPYRREGMSYVPNVFLPSPHVKNADINFVDSALYERCHHFFDDILQIQKPNEYELFIKDIRRRYEERQQSDDAQHIEDIRSLLKCLNHIEYQEAAEKIMREFFELKCKDGMLRCPYMHRVFFPVDHNGIDIEWYFRNINPNVYFVDVDYYIGHGIDFSALQQFGVQDSIMTGNNIQNGMYEIGAGERSLSWYTNGEFRWKLSIEQLKEVVQYISQHPSAKDALLKSQTIIKILIANENRLCGCVHINSNSVPDKEDEPCEMIHILRGERVLGWEGKWLFTESGEVVSPKSIFRHELSAALYGKIHSDSIIFTLLGFKKTDEDEVDELKKIVPKKQLDAYFEREFLQRFGISTTDFNEKYGALRQREYNEEETQLPFPTLQVRSWDALRKHAEEMLVYADPVRYEARIRSIRVSNHPREVRAYLSNMYRHTGANRFKYACQMCHDTCSSFEATEIFLQPETELDPVNLCLCPNCAAKYRQFRANAAISNKIRNEFMAKSDADIESEDYVAVAINDDYELWFTQTHFAEIRELMRLAEEAKNATTQHTVEASPDDEDERSGLSVYSGLVGKKLKRKDGFVGFVKEITGSGERTYLEVDIIEGREAGGHITLNLVSVLNNKGKYTITD